jgi:cilia- and flagella-associated protein 52
LNHDDYKLVASTAANVQILSIDQVNKKIASVNCNMGNMKRSFTCLAIDPKDEYIYAGTKTGDIIEI